MQVKRGSNSAQEKVFSFTCCEGYERTVYVSSADVEDFVALMDIARCMSKEEYEEIVNIARAIK